MDIKRLLVISLIPTVAIIVCFALLLVYLNKDTQQAASAQPQAQSSASDTTQASLPPQTQAYAMAVGKYEGEVPELINILDQMGGFKEDPDVAPADTVYVVYDPRCPYCESLYNKLDATDLESKEITIKWLPTVALGADGIEDPAVSVAAYGLAAKDKADFASTFKADSAPDGYQPDTDSLMRLDENLAFLHEASNQTFGEDHAKSVPAVFFVDKTTGRPQMMYGATDDGVFKSIFGD